eukprot:769240-Pyramimonas_sp.AAC.1
MTLTRDIAAVSSWACPASSMMSSAVDTSLSDSAASWVAMTSLASLSSWERNDWSSLEGPFCLG